MDGPFEERDWKYMRSIKEELLHRLCSDANQRAVEIATSKLGNPYERHLLLYKHIRKTDGTIAECFDDWRRSRLALRVMSLRRYKLLSDEHVEQLSEDGQRWIEHVEEMAE